MIRRLRAALRGYFKKGDIIIIAALISASLALGAAALVSGRERTGGQQAYAVITRGGEELAKLPLGADSVYVISDSDAYNVITVRGGSVYMSEADCPDRLCVSEGAVSRPGQMIVCLPNRVVVSIEPEDGAAVDSVAY